MFGIQSIFGTRGAAYIKYGWKSIFSAGTGRERERGRSWGETPAIRKVSAQSEECREHST